MGTAYQEQAKVFKALCDPKRLAILEQLRSGEKCACVLQEPLDLTQSGLSYHMKILCDSGIVVSRQEGSMIEKLRMEKYVESFVLSAGSVDIESPDLTIRERLTYAKEQMLGTFKKVFPYWTVSQEERGKKLLLWR